MEKRYFVFRTDDYTKEWIYGEIQKGNLRQGWGVSSLQLKEKDGIDVPQDTWINRFKTVTKRVWNEDTSDKEAYNRYSILYPMIEMKKGDVVVVPKMPDYDKFLVAIVEKPYFFDYKPKEERNGFEDFRHIIGIDKSNIKIFHYSSSNESKIITNKFKGYRSAVNNVWNNEFIKAVDELLTRDSDLKPKGLDVIISDIRKNVCNDYIKGLIKLGPGEMENIVKKIFENAGYEYLESHRYDKEGGDADIIFKKPVPIISDYSENDMKVYVQVKNKIGNDIDDVSGVDQVIKITENEPCAIKILVSTVESFSEQCVKKALENNVVLISGEKLVELAIKYL